MKIKLSAITDIGKEREHNEDAFVLCPDLSNPDWSLDETAVHLSLGPYGSLAVVADGMGGANAGDVASSMAIDAIKKHFTTHALGEVIKSDTAICQFLSDYVKDASESIQTHAFDHPETAGMGTTIVVCWILKQEDETKAHIAWCGDSRCYLYNPKEGLRQLTKDHSYVQDLVDKGEITEEEAFNHPDGNLITRGLGDLDFDAQADFVSHTLQAGDWLLLCSDGLCGYCTNEAIANAVKGVYPDVTACRDRLLKVALDAGGYDNITIAIVSAIGDDEAEPKKVANDGGFLKWFKGLFCKG
ncbi:MAG: serine/threonine-protein phosphatase [Prevotella sp.]|nr:serine/threonine-protein phosphatase [Prevotella sp.]